MKKNNYTYVMSFTPSQFCKLFNILHLSEVISLLAQIELQKFALEHKVFV